jgi:hypothetical protein
MKKEVEKKKKEKGKNLTSFCDFLKKYFKFEISHLFKTKLIFQKMEIPP